jgi:hypothetical protein
LKVAGGGWVDVIAIKKPASAKLTGGHLKSDLADAKPSTPYPSAIPALSATNPTKQQQPQFVVWNIMDSSNNAG